MTGDDEARALWDAWRDGSLSEADGVRLANALREDASRATLAEQAGVDGALRALMSAEDEPLLRGVRAEIEARRDEARFVAAFKARQQQLEAPRARIRRRSRAPWLVVAALAAAAALAFVVREDRPGLARVVEVGAGTRVVAGGKIRAVHAGDSLRAGARVVTDDRGLTLEYPDASWLAFGPDARVRLVRPSGDEKRLVLDRGWLAADLTDVAAAGPIAMETPHAFIEGRAADFRVTVDETDTKVHVSAGFLAITTKDPKRHFIIRAGESMTAPLGEPATLRRRPTPPPLASVPDDSKAQGPAAIEAAKAMASTLGEPPGPGRSLPLAWDKLRPVGIGRWEPLPDGARQVTPSREYDWDYSKGAVNMGQVDIRQAGSFRARARVRAEGADGKWNIALVLRFRVPGTATCGYTVRGGDRFVMLDFHQDGGPLPPFSYETFPRGPGPVSFEETYWIELDVERPTNALATVACRVWADGAPRPEAGLSAEVDVDGQAAWLGFRTYRTAASFEAVDVTVEPR